MIEGSNDLALLYVYENVHLTFFGGKHLSRLYDTSSGNVKHQSVITYLFYFLMEACR